jgi:hypothetical protein
MAWQVRILCYIENCGGELYWVEYLQNMLNAMFWYGESDVKCFTESEYLQNLFWCGKRDVKLLLLTYQSEYLLTNSNILVVGCGKREISKFKRIFIENSHINISTELPYRLRWMASPVRILKLYERTVEWSLSPNTCRTC